MKHIKTFESYESNNLINEGKFKVDDLVYNKKTKTIGIVRLGDDKYGEVKTDADGNVNVDDLEKYNPIKNKHHREENVDVAPSTEKEINSRGLFKPFKNESKNIFENKTIEIYNVPYDVKENGNVFTLENMFGLDSIDRLKRINPDNEPYGEKNNNFGVYITENDIGWEFLNKPTD